MKMNQKEKRVAHASFVSGLGVGMLFLEYVLIAIVAGGEIYDWLSAGWAVAFTVAFLWLTFSKTFDKYTAKLKRNFFDHVYEQDELKARKRGK